MCAFKVKLWTVKIPTSCRCLWLIYQIPAHSLELWLPERQYRSWNNTIIRSFYKTLIFLFSITDEGGSSITCWWYIHVLLYQCVSWGYSGSYYSKSQIISCRGYRSYFIWACISHYSGKIGGKQGYFMMKLNIFYSGYDELTTFRNRC